jgi:hypothetical protein
MAISASLNTLAVITEVNGLEFEMLIVTPGCTLLHHSKVEQYLSTNLGVPELISA